MIVELPAQQDFAVAHLWLTKREPNTADRWFNSIYDTIGSLAILPERRPLAPESKFLDEEIRELFHGCRQHKYRILFTVSENEVPVLHVGQGARLALGESKPSKEWTIIAHGLCLGRIL